MPKIEQPGFNPGGHEDIFDARDFKWSDIAGGFTSFDWTKGFDIEDKLTSVLGSPFVFENFDDKDQDGSFSCGGQAIGYYGAVKEALATKSFERRSARFLYSQVFIPGSGSRMRDVFDISINQGFAKESVLTSYENGLPPSETFMEKTSDITLAVRNDAKLSQGLSYFYVDQTSIDSVAQAIEQNDGVILLLTGQNDTGTWLSEFPALTTRIDWRHFMYAGKAKMVNGKKTIIAKQSWGKAAGNKGWQCFPEEWFTSGNVLQVGALVYNNSGTPQFRHTFSVNMSLGQSGDEIKMLQKALRMDGEFTYPSDTGFYGEVTRAAVLAFQNKYKIPTSGTNGTVVGPLTRTQLNKLYS